MESVREMAQAMVEQLAAITFGDVALWLFSVAIVWVIVRLLRRWIAREVDDVNRRHRLRKLSGYAGVFVVIALGLALFVGRLGQLAAILGLLAAGLAIALQDVAKSVAGWLWAQGQPGFGPGARIEVDGLVGDVIDVGLLKTTVLEVGNLVYGRQSSGRLATIPNSRLLGSSTFFTPDYAPYAWQELRFLFTYESNWRKAVGLLEEAAAEEYETVAEPADRACRRLEERYAIVVGTRTPIVYANAADSGVELTVRYLTHIRRRRGTADHITRRLLEAVEAEPDLDFAYPTTRVYRRGEEAWAVEAPSGSLDADPRRTGLQ